MSAKLSIIVYILICLEVGILLAILPWTSYWSENFFLDFISGRWHAQGVVTFLQSGYVRGAVSALGILNIALGMRDIFRFRQNVNELTAWEVAFTTPPSSTNIEKSSNPPTHLSDH
ncbi:MAG TPA: hypothetical protein VEF04_05130 [Blastocatellia bacterium]|nr:hypothetical protein [Blastocatellia bacterium]